MFINWSLPALLQSSCLSSEQWCKTHFYASCILTCWYVIKAVWFVKREHRDRDSGERRSKGSRRKEHSLWSCASHLASQMLFSRCTRTLGVSTSLAWWWAVGITSQDLGQLLNRVSKWVMERVECFSLKRSESWGKEKKTFSRREDKKFKKITSEIFVREIESRYTYMTNMTWEGNSEKDFKSFLFSVCNPPLGIFVRSAMNIWITFPLFLIVMVLLWPWHHAVSGPQSWTAFKPVTCEKRCRRKRQK